MDPQTTAIDIAGNHHHAVCLCHWFCVSFRDFEDLTDEWELTSHTNPFGNGVRSSVRNKVANLDQVVTYTSM